MKSPTRSVAVVRRQLTRARRDRCMVVLHPDTVEWLALMAAARANCVLEPKEAKAIVRLLGMLQDHLEDAIDNELAAGEKEPRDKKRRLLVLELRRDWQAAEQLVKVLTGAKP